MIESKVISRHIVMRQVHNICNYSHTLQAYTSLQILYLSKAKQVAAVSTLYFQTTCTPVCRRMCVYDFTMG